MTFDQGPLRTIDDCENRANYHIARIKRMLDREPNEADRLNMWRFTCIVLGVLEGIIRTGWIGVKLVWGQFRTFSRAVRAIQDQTKGLIL